MPDPTYLYGYADFDGDGVIGGWFTVAQLEQRAPWYKLHPEFRRRLLAMFDAADKAGQDLGIGGGWRSSALQEATFRDRYYVVSCPGDVWWDGKCWKKRAGVASAAPPGRSYHEETTPDGYALAADLILPAALPWMNAHCAAFGLKHFGSVNREPWHVQPVEVPNARSNYDPAVHVLQRWILPGDPPPLGDDMRPIVTTWSGEQWPILVSFDPERSQYTWRGFPGPSIDDAIRVGAVTDGRATPWPSAWKSQTWVRRIDG